MPQLAGLQLPTVPVIADTSPVEVIDSTVHLENEHTCGAPKAFGVHASKGSTFDLDNIMDSKIYDDKMTEAAGDISLADMSVLLQRQHRELTQRLDQVLNRQEEFMKRFAFREHLNHIHGDHDDLEPIFEEHRHCVHDKKKMPTNVSLAINDYIHHASTMEGENQKRRSQAREKSRRSLMNRSTTDIRFDEATGFIKKTMAMVRSVEFEFFFAIMILSSSAFVGVQVEYAASERTDKEPTSFEIVQNTYAIIFAVELILRILANGFRVFYKPGEWAWYWLDTLIVLSSLVEFIISLANLASSKENQANMKNMSTMRIARIVRVTRLIRVFRIVRIVRFVRALRTLVQSIIYTLRSLVWAMLLLALVIYVFGILFTQATTDYVLGEDYIEDLVLEKYWGSMSSSMMTLFKSIAGGISWTTVTDALTDVSWGWTMLFVVYIIFAYFAVLNVMTGVFCQSAIESAQRDQDMVVSQQLKMKERYVNQVTKLFKDIDNDESGCITIQEFEDHLENKNVKALFDSLELEIDDAWTLFSLIDTDGSHVIDIEEFVDGCVRLRGSAKSIDVARLSYENKWVRKKLSAFMRYMEAQMRMMMGGIYDFEAEEKQARNASSGNDSSGRHSTRVSTMVVNEAAASMTPSDPADSKSNGKDRFVLHTASSQELEDRTSEGKQPRFSPYVSLCGEHSMSEVIVKR